MNTDPLRITPADWTTVPWRNGCGTSQAILSRPDLVLNRSPIIEPADFSAYLGFDRLLVVLTGQLELTIEGQHQPLGAKDLCRFPGEANVTAVPAGDCLVFNVLARRDHWRIGDAWLDAVPARTDNGITILHVIEGVCDAESDGTLQAGETLLTQSPARACAQNGWCIFVELQPKA